MTWVEHHTASSRAAGEAEVAARAGLCERATALYRQAAEAEVRALNALDRSKSRTLGITASSAVALWFKAHEYDRAKQLAYRMLSDGLPLFAREQIEELLDAIRTKESERRAGTVFSAAGVLVSVRGGLVLHGAAPLDLILRKVEELRAILYRTAEYVFEMPHRTRGFADLRIQSMFQPWIFQAPAGSYQFSIKVKKPDQTEFFDEEGPEIERVTQSFVDIISATATDPEVALREIVPDRIYRATFIKLGRNLAPAGEDFSSLEIRPTGLENTQPVVFLPSSRVLLSEVIRKEFSPVRTANARSEEVTGVLRAVDLNRDWIELAVGDNSEQRLVRVYGAGETVDDVIGPMVNRMVAVDAVRTQFGRLKLRDIQLAT